MAKPAYNVEMDASHLFAVSHYLKREIDTLAKKVARAEENGTSHALGMRRAAKDIATLQEIVDQCETRLAQHIVMEGFKASLRALA